MANRGRLTPVQRAELDLHLKERRRLMQLLAPLSIKRLAAFYGITPKCIYERDEDLHGFHEPDPRVNWRAENCLISD